MSSERIAPATVSVRGCIRHIIVATAVGLTATTAYAAGGEAETEVAALDQVIVTGTRLGQTGFSTPTPVTVIDGAAMQDLGITNVGVAVNQLPSFRATTTPTTNGWGSFNVGAQGVNLRGLGQTRNLVLVDGRRAPPVSREGTVDLNMIPSGLVKRIDVVTGGASAQYGSDAIAGAVNVLLDRNLEGIKGQLDYGVTAAGDGSNYHLELAGGSRFADGRGHFILGGEYAKSDGIGDCFTRSYCQGGAVITNTGSGALVTPGVTYPNFLRYEQGGGFFANTRGVVSFLNNTTAASAPIYNLFGTRGVTFRDDGTPVAYTLGIPANGTNSTGDEATSGMTTSQLEVPVERYATFGHAYYDVSDRMRVFVEGSYNHVDGTVLQSRYFGTPVTIFNDNPFVPAALRAVMPTSTVPTNPSTDRPAAGVFNLSILGQRRGQSTSFAGSWRLATGFEGKLGDRWDVDGYYQYARTDRLQKVENLMVTGAGRVLNRPNSGGINNPESYAYLQWATDVVLDSSGKAVCRATLSSDSELRAAAAGCLPLNLFGTANTDPAALDYVYRTLWEDINITQHAVAANIHGELAQLWAGPLVAATGVEYRHDATEVVHDTISNVFAYFQNFGADYNAAQNVVEGYVEASLPLLTNVPAVKSLVLNGAVRYANYDISGFGSFNRAAATSSFDATTWKVGLVWEPTDWMRTRVTVSKDYRAPNFSELFLASASNFASVSNPFRANSNAEFPVGLAGGNPVIGPETGHTTTFGLVLQPPVVPGLSFSADYYDIKVDDYIGGAGGSQAIATRCFQGNQQMCDLITFGPNNELLEVRGVNINLQWLKTRGVDVEVAYALPLSRFSQLPGALNFRLLGTKTLENSTNLFGIITNRVGETGGGGSPNWMSSLFAGYTLGEFQTNVTARYISRGVLNATYRDPTDKEYADYLADPALRQLTINDNHVGGVVYFNWNGSLGFGPEGRYQVFAQVNNLLNRAPPSAPQAAYPSNPTYFDLIGRSYRVGVRFKF
jgi:outer membrane receptor protein involved in Fe transport